MRSLTRKAGVTVISVGLACCALVNAAAESARVLNRSSFHLRSGTNPEWDEFKHKTPDGAGLVLRFRSEANSREATLLITQDNVKLDWPVHLNGSKIGTLFLMEAPLVHAITVPPGALREGENTLSIQPPKANDDILIHRIALDLRPQKEALNEAALDIQISDRETGLGLPCRVTIIDELGRLAPLSSPNGRNLALRPGVAYTGDGRARVGIQPGKHTVYATRGFEYGLAVAQVSVVEGQTATVTLQLHRDVPTPGLVCSDTHIHTGTYARHGDATIEERAITLAGEGIELPVSTEHDCLVDYAGAADRTGVHNWFTPVIGDEVTTAKGHFNIFPVGFLATLPDKQITEWPRLMERFRATPEVQVVVLNHPRNVHSDFQPFASTNFNALTGENLRGFEFSFDAIEVANSSALQSNWMLSFHDWFALLNYGYRFTAVGSSDGHDVSRYIVGQGRTYISCADTNPARIDIVQACRNLKAGRALVSLGLLANMSLNQKFGVGDLATGIGESMNVRVSVSGPPWVTADRIELFANGIRIRDHKIELGTRAADPGQNFEPLKVEISWDIPRPKHDVHLVALASGPGVREPYWSVARPYQPSSPTWNPRVLGATNPIWIDADGDGSFTSARGYAQRLVRKHSADPSALFSSLSLYDEAVAVQAGSLRSGAASTPEIRNSMVPGF